MRTLALMVAFGLGTALLLPRPARSLDNCLACNCKHMKAWVEVPRQDLAYGMRMIDPMDPEKMRTIAIDHVHAPPTPGNILSTAATEGEIDSQGKTYDIYRYTEAFTLDCKLAEKESEKSVVTVTPTKTEFWDKYVAANKSEVHYLCVKKKGEN